MNGGPGRDAREHGAGGPVAKYKVVEGAQVSGEIFVKTRKVWRCPYGTGGVAECMDAAVLWSRLFDVPLDSKSA